VSDLLTVFFPKINHFWIDSGILGLYEMARQTATDDMPVAIDLRDDGVAFTGTVPDLETFFDRTYRRLLNEYYNLSTQRQKEENAGFYYDTERKVFERFPKIKTRGVAGLVSNAARSYRPTQSEVKYEKSAKHTNPYTEKPGKLLPAEYADVQDAFDRFLAETGLKAEASGLLIDGPNTVYPKIQDFRLGRKPAKGACFICGRPSTSFGTISGTVCPTITGPEGVLSFNTCGGSPDKVCWQCDFIAKFAPVNGFYLVTPEKTFHLYFPYSPSLLAMYAAWRSLQGMKIADQNHIKNFDIRLGHYFQRPYELFFAFLYSLYSIVLVGRQAKGLGEEDEEDDFYEHCDLSAPSAQVDFYVLHSEALGKSQMPKMIWPFRESVYVFRLFDRLEEEGIRIKRAMHTLIDFGQTKHENKTLARNRICERMLTKQPIVDLVERHVFSISRSEPTRIGALVRMTIAYEKIIRSDPMQQELIDTAVSLGRTIGYSLTTKGKKGKSELFRLRKARTMEDFLNEVNRLQMRYDTVVTEDLYGKGEEIGANFAEFKQFAMIAALNMVNESQNSTKTAGAPASEGASA
jgi:hypothetical protein